MSRFFPNAKRSLDSLLNLITDLVADGLLFFHLMSTGMWRFSWHHSAMAVRLRRNRFFIVLTCTVNFPFRLRAQMCVKPRKSRVQGFFPCLFAFASACR